MLSLNRTLSCRDHHPRSTEVGCYERILRTSAPPELFATLRYSGCHRQAPGYIKTQSLPHLIPDLVEEGGARYVFYKATNRTHALTKED